MFQKIEKYLIIGMLKKCQFSNRYGTF